MKFALIPRTQLPELWRLPQRARMRPNNQKAVRHFPPREISLQKATSATYPCIGRPLIRLPKAREIIRKTPLLLLLRICGRRLGSSATSSTVRKTAELFSQSVCKYVELRVIRILLDSEGRNFITA